MMLAAWNDGVASCPNRLPDPAPVGELLGLGEAERVVIVLSFGSPAVPSTPLPPRPRRGRRAPTAGHSSSPPSACRRFRGGRTL
jgi:nitroreductase